VLSQIPTSASVFVRPAGSGAGDDGSNDSTPVVLTVVAQ
jgi:hypothetical protein